MGKLVTRLFRQFQPDHYELHMILDREAMSFAGTVTVRGKKVGRPAQRLTFHQKGLSASRATITKHDKKGDRSLEVVRLNKQASLDELRLHTAEMVYPGSYSVTIEFTGKITRQMTGIYPSFFKLDGQDKQLIATQFESHFAREAFPCIDEPEAKAVFDLTLETPTGETVVANTPIKQQEVVPNPTPQTAKSKGRKPKTDNSWLKTTFETTPRMSTYLLAFAFGDLGYKESKTKQGVVVRAYATSDKVELTAFALDVAVRSLEFFTGYFGVPYPLPKFDILALPDFDAAAMENWGLVTFREVAMLADPKTTSIESKQLIAMVVAHETSHMWFGDLVTMKWWDDIWLNESFANLMEYMAVDALYPEWHIWEQFVMQETGSAKRRDSLPDVQPIKTEVRHPDEIGSLFDPSIVYAKGGSVLRMLLSNIGELAFREGLSTYFKRHAYGNTQASDLWAALSASSQQDIGSFMNHWLTRPGYPMVSVAWQPGTAVISLQQQRFLNDPNLPLDNSLVWPVPLAATWPLDNSLLSKPEAQIKLKSEGRPPLLFNHDGQSYFLPRYANPAHLEEIVKSIRAKEVDVIDRMQLLDTYTMLQRGGFVSTTDLLELLPAYAEERSENVWGAIAVAVSETRKLIEGDNASDARLDRLLSGLVIQLAEELGWDDRDGESAQTLRLRGLAYSLAASGKIQAVLDEGLQRFRAMEQPGQLPASTRAVVFFTAARYGTIADFRKLLKLYQTVSSADEKEEIASGLTSAKDPERYEQLIALLPTDTVRRQDLMHWYVWLLRSRYARQTTWHWLVTHWDWILQEFSNDKSFSYFARYAGAVFSSPSELRQFKDFFGPKKSVVAMSRNITLAEQEITSRIAWRQRNEAGVKIWLKDHYGAAET